MTQDIYMLLTQKHVNLELEVKVHTYMQRKPNKFLMDLLFVSNKQFGMGISGAHFEMLLNEFLNKYPDIFVFYIWQITHYAGLAIVFNVFSSKYENKLVERRIYEQLTNYFVKMFLNDVKKFKSNDYSAVSDLCMYLDNPNTDLLQKLHAAIARIEEFDVIHAIAHVIQTREHKIACKLKERMLKPIDLLYVDQCYFTHVVKLFYNDITAAIACNFNSSVPLKTRMHALSTLMYFDAMNMNVYKGQYIQFSKYPIVTPYKTPVEHNNTQNSTKIRYICWCVLRKTLNDHYKLPKNIVIITDKRMNYNKNDILYVKHLFNKNSLTLPRIIVWIINKNAILEPHFTHIHSHLYEAATTRLDVMRAVYNGEIVPFKFIYDTALQIMRF